jgi:hypothetical protein
MSLSPGVHMASSLATVDAVGSIEHTHMKRVRAADDTPVALARDHHAGTGSVGVWRGQTVGLGA